MQQYANAMHVQQYQQYAMLHQHNPALVCITNTNLIKVSTNDHFFQMSQMYAPQYDPQRNGGQVINSARDGSSSGITDYKIQELN